MKQFIKKDELQLINGGYLSNSKGNPVYNANFVALQTHANYIVTFARLAKTKNFVTRTADNVQELEKEVKELLSKNKTIQFVSKPEAVKRPVTEKLKSEALSFMNFQEEVGNKIKVNTFLQKFKALAEFEEFGLFFTEDIVKLDKIYTLAEIVEAVEQTIDLL